MAFRYLLSSRNSYKNCNAASQNWRILRDVFGITRLLLGSQVWYLAINNEPINLITLLKRKFTYFRGKAFLFHDGDESAKVGSRKFEESYKKALEEAKVFHERLTFERAIAKTREDSRHLKPPHYVKLRVRYVTVFVITEQYNFICFFIVYMFVTLAFSSSDNLHAV